MTTDWNPFDLNQLKQNLSVSPHGNTLLFLPLPHPSGLHTSWLSFFWVCPPLHIRASLLLLMCEKHTLAAFDLPKCLYCFLYNLLLLVRFVLFLLFLLLFCLYCCLCGVAAVWHYLCCCLYNLLLLVRLVVCAFPVVVAAVLLFACTVLLFSVVCPAFAAAFGSPTVEKPTFVALRPSKMSITILQLISLPLTSQKINDQL